MRDKTIVKIHSRDHCSRKPDQIVVYRVTLACCSCVRPTRSLMAYRAWCHSTSMLTLDSESVNSNATRQNHRALMYSTRHSSRNWTWRNSGPYALSLQEMCLRDDVHLVAESYFLKNGCKKLVFRVIRYTPYKPRGSHHIMVSQVLPCTVILNLKQINDTTATEVNQVRVMICLPNILSAKKSASDVMVGGINWMNMQCNQDFDIAWWTGGESHTSFMTWVCLKDIERILALACSILTRQLWCLACATGSAPKC